MNHGIDVDVVATNQVGEDWDLNLGGSCGTGQEGVQARGLGSTVTGDGVERGLGGEGRVRAGPLIQEDAGILRNEKEREEIHVCSLHLFWGIGRRLLDVPGFPGPGSRLRADSACPGLWPSNP